MHVQAHPTQSTPPERAAPRLRSLLLALLLATLTVATVFVVPAAPAQAAGSWGAGGFGWSSNGTWLGNFVAANGTRVYCVDLHVSGVGSGGDAGDIATEISQRGGGAGGGTRALSGAELRMLNYAITVHGQTDDDVTAAAVAAYVWNFTSTNHYGNGAHYIGGPRAAEILLRYQQIAADTEANAHREGGTGTGQLTFDVDANNHYLGNMTVTTNPSDALGTVTLTHGVFADTGSQTRSGVRHGDVYPVLGIAPDDGSDYRISASGAFTAEGLPSYHANVRLHSDADQRTAGPGTHLPGIVNFSVEGQDSVARSSSFEPIVGTQVAAVFLSESDTMSDVLTFSTQANADGVHNPWYRNQAGEYVAVTAEATIYGPFLTQPLESDDVPPNAPIAASDIRVTTTPADGPTIDYTVESGFSPSEAGFYTWVWRIRADAQPELPSGARAFLPENYDYADRFGQVAETSISPTKLAITTELAATEANIGEVVTDEVTVSVYGGGWLQHEGQRVPATLTGTAYFSATEPVLAEHAPPEAETIGTLQLTFTESGTLTSEALTLPLRAGYVTFQWCVVEEHQSASVRGLLAETCDRYGQASETVQVFEPLVTTLATQQAAPGEAIYDTAVVDGVVPEGAGLVFALYEKAEGQTTPSCEAANLISTSELVSIQSGHNELAHYRSPEVTVEREGTYWWVESLVHDDAETGERHVISSGECGIKNETTTVAVPPPPAPISPSLAATGSTATPISWGIGSLLGVAGAGAIVTSGWLRRRAQR